MKNIKKNIYYMSLRTQFENLGDLLIAQATIDLISKHGDLIIDTRGVPSDFIKMFSFPENVTLNKKDFISVIFKYKNSKLIYVVKAGGYSEAKTLKAKLRLIFKTFYFKTLKLLFHVKILRMPHSYSGDLNIYEFKYQQIFDLNLCRDNQTYNLYNNNGLENIQFLEDLALYYFNKNSKFLYKEFSNVRSKALVSLRYDRLDNEIDVTMNVIKYLKLHNYIEDYAFVNQVKFDEKINNELAVKYKKKHIKYDLTNESINNIVHEYSECKYIISNRLHVLLLAMINGAIPIAIIDLEKDKKILGCLDSLNITWFDKDKLLQEKYIENIIREKYNFDILSNEYEEKFTNIIKKLK